VWDEVLIHVSRSLSDLPIPDFAGLSYANHFITKNRNSSEQMSSCRGKSDHDAPDAQASQSCRDLKAKNRHHQPSNSYRKHLEDSLPE